MSGFNTIITGTGRCGTGYFAKLLNSMGISCGHESVFDLSGVEIAKKRISGEVPFVISCTCGAEFNKKAHKETCMSNILKEIKGKSLNADSSYMSAPFLDDESFKNYNFIHVLRNPYNVIKSFVQVANYFKKENSPFHSIGFEKFIKSHLNIVYDNDFEPADRGFLYYVGWNKMIKDKTYNRKTLVYRVEENDENKILNFLNKNSCDLNLKNEKINHWHNKIDKPLEFKVFKREFDQLMIEYEDFC